MTAIIILALTIWAISAVVKSTKQKQAERNRQTQIARINAENMKRRAEAQRMREEFKARQLEAKLEVERMVAIEREQMRLAKEQQRQAEALLRHEKELSKLTFRIEKAEETIAHHTELLDTINAQLGIAEADLKATSDKLFVMNYQLANAENTPEKKLAELRKEAERTARQKTQLENKVITLKNRKFSSEQKIKTAQFDKAEAERNIG